MLIFERLEHLKKSWFFDANYFSGSLAIPKKNCAHAQSFFELPIPIPIPSKFSQKRMTYSLIPIPSGLRGMITSGYTNSKWTGLVECFHLLKNWSWHWQRLVECFHFVQTLILLPTKLCKKGSHFRTKLFTFQNKIGLWDGSLWKKYS